MHKFHPFFVFFGENYIYLVAHDSSQALLTNFIPTRTWIWINYGAAAEAACAFFPNGPEIDEAKMKLSASRRAGPHGPWRLWRLMRGAAAEQASGLSSSKHVRHDWSAETPDIPLAVAKHKQHERVQTQSFFFYWKIFSPEARSFD